MKKWLKAATVRAIKTLAQTAVATIGAAAILSEVDWPTVASAAALAAVLSYLTSIAGLPEVDESEIAKIGAERTDADRRDDSEVDHAED